MPDLLDRAIVMQVLLTGLASWYWIYRKNRNRRVCVAHWRAGCLPDIAFRPHGTGLWLIAGWWLVMPHLVQAEPTASSSPAVDTAQPARRALIEEEIQPFQWGLHIDTDAVDTLSGGLQRGTVGNNVIHAALAVDTEKLGGPRGGRFAVSAMRISSGEASVNRIGDLQVADNLDASSTSRVYQLWYRQILSAGDTSPLYSLRAGLIDFNENFASNDAASILLNASFGLDPTLSANVPISTYPKPGWGFETAALWPNWQLRFGLFQPNPDARNSGFSDGHFLVGQFDHEIDSQSYPTTISLGLWQYHQTDRVLSSIPTHDQGVYASIDTGLGTAGNAAQVFLQLGYAPKAVNTVPRYIGVGVQTPSPFSHRPYDRFTAGIAHAEINQSPAGSETSYEVSYLFNVNHYATIQPDLQYIRHPSGQLDIPNAWVAIMRLHLEFH